MKWAMPRVGKFQAAVFAVALLLLGVYALAVKVAHDFYDNTAMDRSVFNDAPEGLSIWYRYLDAIDVEAGVLRDFDELPADGIIIAAGPFEYPATEEQAERLGTWVEEGGRLVLVGWDVHDLMSPLDLGAGPAGGLEAGEVAPCLPSIYAHDVQTIDPGYDRLAAVSGSWITHFGDPDEAVLISTVRGKGAVVWLASSHPVSNEGIGEADNAQLAVLLAGGGRSPVYFDEFHHGYTSGQGVWDRLDISGRWVTVLALLAAAILIASSARRLGPAIPANEAPAARTAAHIGTLAELYRRAGARAEALGSLEEGLKRSLARRHGTLDGGLLRHAHAADALRRSESLRSAGSIGTSAFLAVARELRRARQEVDGRDG